MAKAKLPEAFREKIKALFKEGDNKDEVFRLVRTEDLRGIQLER